MKPRFALLWFALSMSGSGCALWQDAHHNLTLTLKAPIEAHNEKVRNRQWAEEAWLTVAARSVNYSQDYAEGFKDGFADYLYRGGDGDLALMPPLRYRNVRYQNPEGYAAIQDWHKGYRHGVSVARASGAREWITGPSPTTVAPGAVASAKFPLPTADPIHETPTEPFFAPPQGPPSTPMLPPATTGQIKQSQPTPEVTRARITGVSEAPTRARITRTAVTPN